jgi:hypothetical protein
MKPQLAPPFPLLNGLGVKNSSRGLDTWQNTAPKKASGGIAMNSQTRREVRSGLIALPLSGLLFALGILLRGSAGDLTDPVAYVLRAATSPYYVPGWTMILVGFVLQLYGAFGLYRYLTYQAENGIAFLAFVLRIVGIALGLPLVAFLAVDAPAIADLAQQGIQEVIAVAEANFTSALGLALLGVASGGASIGLILFAIAIWRDGRLPKWTVVLLVLALPLLAFPVTLASEFLGALLLLISTGMIAWKGWQESTARVGR